MEFTGELAVLVARQPVLVVEARDDGANTFADRGVIFSGANSARVAGAPAGSSAPLRIAWLKRPAIKMSAVSP